MIALDTNILVRLVVNDEPAQARKAAARLDAGDAFFVPLTVTLELEWVLRGVYSLSVEAVTRSLESLMSIRNVHFEGEARISGALTQYARGLDFADALHLGASSDCEYLLTFDRKFSKLSVREKFKPPVALLK